MPKPLTVLDVFSDANVRDYYRVLPVEPFLGQVFFPDSEKIPELEISYILGANRYPVIANIHAMDSETEIGERDGITLKSVELLKIARKLQLKESDIRKLNQPRNTAEQEYVASVLYDDVTNMRESVRTRIEQMRMEALANGKVVINGNGIIDGTIDYQVPTENKYDIGKLPGGLAWSDPDAPILNDLFAMQDALVRRGGDMVTRALTSRKILAFMLMNKGIRAAFHGVNAEMLMTPESLNQLLTTQNLPTIATYDKYYRAAGKKHNTYEPKRFFPEEKFVMMPEVRLGETVYGITAEELARNVQVQYSESDNILTMVWNEIGDPPGTWTKSCAIAIPTFPEAGNVIQAKVLA